MKIIFLAISMVVSMSSFGSSPQITSRVIFSNILGSDEVITTETSSGNNKISEYLTKSMHAESGTRSSRIFKTHRFLSGEVMDRVNVKQALIDLALLIHADNIIVEYSYKHFGGFNDSSSLVIRVENASICGIRKDINLVIQKGKVDQFNDSSFFGVKYQDALGDSSRLAYEQRILLKIAKLKVDLKFCESVQELGVSSPVIQY